jgi:hypothetical protein
MKTKVNRKSKPQLAPEILLEQNSMIKGIDLNQNLKGKKDIDINIIGLYSHKNSISSNNS